MVDGVAGLGIALLLVILLAQVAAVITTRHALHGAALGAARRVAHTATNPVAEQAALLMRLHRSLPGVGDPTATVGVEGDLAIARIVATINPPGPGWATHRVTVTAAASLVIPP